MSPRLNLCLVAAASLVLAACGGPGKVKNPAAEIAPPKGPPPSDVVVDPGLLRAATDPCGARLHDMCEPLLLYYAAVHRLPNTLRELGAFADEKLDFTCPVSGEEYVYRPVPLVGNQSQLIMYDRSPVHGHMRWGIIVSPKRDTHPLQFDAIPMNDEIFKRYLPDANDAPTAAPLAPDASVPAH